MDLGWLRRDRILVVDFEETCWDAERPEGEHVEIIDVGVVEILLDGPPRMGRTFTSLVRPVRSSVSGYCTALTGIGRAEAARGRPFHEVCATMEKTFGASKAWGAWGRDLNDLDRDCAFHGIGRPLSDAFFDIGHLWSALTGSNRGIGVDEALRALGMEYEGRRHRALPDAANTARIVMEIATTLRGRIAR